MDRNPEKTIKVLEDTSVDLLTWFQNNGMKSNGDNGHLLVNSKERVHAKIGPCDIQRNSGAIIGNKLTFDKHTNNSCAKASRKTGCITPSVIVH